MHWISSPTCGCPLRAGPNDFAGFHVAHGWDLSSPPLPFPFTEMSASPFWELQMLPLGLCVVSLEVEGRAGRHKIEKWRLGLYYKQL